MAQRSSFLQGLTTGVLFTLLVGVVVIHSPQPGSSLAAGLPELDQVLTWVNNNLGLSLPVFGLLLVLYLRSLHQLKGAVAQNAAIEQVAQADQMIDTWTSLFFGVGVIWTAIGMRSALVYALGEPELALNLGAYAILERMVEGGILLALSTTIFGGIGGYVLRVVKALSVDTELKRYYDRLAHAPALEMQVTLSAIEAHVQRLAPQTLQQEETEHGEADLVSRAAPRSGHR